MTQPVLSRRFAITATLLGTSGLSMAASTQPHAQSAESATKVKVLAAHPVAHALTRRLIKGSAVVLERATPESLPPTRHAAYFAGRGAASLSAAAESADAVVSLRSVWPEDPLFPLARRANIRIIEIDAARPVDGALPGVALLPGAPGEGQHAWLDPTNLGRMADIVAHDLKLLAPDSAPRISEQLAQFKQEVVALTASAGTAMAMLEDVTVFSLSDRLDHFATGFNLDLFGRDHRDDTAWTTNALSAFSQRLRDANVGAVLHHREPASEVARGVSEGGARLVVLSTAGVDPLAELAANVDRVVRGLTAT
ncbi:MAG TPA: zinc ABC transporter substrate-binding protein [Hydrogenophaga sp.]|nr:zinc ABC transporter substrate-binding protein [Hydrogenophaga sp.]